MIKICLDGGHSEKPKDFSREDEIDKMVTQKILNLIILLTKQGENKDFVAVIIPDRITDLMEKVRFANIIFSDIYISIHCNWCSKPEPHGFNIFYNDIETASDKELAHKSRLLAEKVSTALQQAGFTYWGKDIEPDTKVMVGNLAVCSYTKMPAILIELGFLSNTKDAEELEKQDVQDRIAKAILQGIRDYVIGF